MALTGYYHDRWEKVGIADDFIFGKVMQRPELCKRMLEIILNIKIERIEYVEPQKVINVKKDARGIRLDIYVSDEQETVYDVEIQTTDTHELREWRRDYMTLQDLIEQRAEQRFQMGHVQGREEGRDQRTEEFALKLLLEWKNIKRTADFCDMPIADVLRIAEKNHIEAEDFPNRKQMLN